MFERYTEQARRVVFYARYEASMFGSATIEPEHLFLGLAREDAELIARLVPATDVVNELRRTIEEKIGTRAKVATSVEIPLSRETKRILAFAYEESQLLSHWHIGTEHLLLGLIRGQGTLVERILRDTGLDIVSARGKLNREEDDSGLAGVQTERAAESIGNASEDLSTRVTIDHIGIATSALDEALRFWRDSLGVAVEHVEVVADQGVRVAMLRTGSPRIELLEPTGSSSPVGKFIEKRGPGLHHIALRVPDIKATLARLKEQGVRLIDEVPRMGAQRCLIAFIHPSATGGVLLELVEPVRDETAADSERR